MGAPVMIHVRPTREQRRAFARWAVAQQPKVRTVSPTTFAVPAHLFTDVPEPVLIGALVDGHRYVSPDEDDQDQAPGGAVLVGEDGPETVVPLRTAVPGEPLPELPAEAYGPGAVPLDPPDFAPLEDAPTGEGAPDRHACDECRRTFTTERGLTAHRRIKHAEES